MAGSMVYRLPVADVSAPRMASFIQAMAAAQAISDNRGYNHIAGFHGAPDFYCWHHQRSRRTPIQARLFLPWHRAYLWWLEQALQDQVPGVALPYWDWTAGGLPASYAARKVGPDPNPLFSTRASAPTATPAVRHRTVRRAGRTPGAVLPTAPEITSLLNDSDWASFSDRLEDFHDHVHVWVGGDMADVTTAAYDPIFFAHHTNIDRIWYLWQVRYGSGGIPANILTEPLMPFNKTPADVLDVQGLGYEYAASTASIPVPAAAGGGHHG
ncbi:MAG: tyrosinase family protein [Actinomycetota bacterium]|nr:tyrosinase family protein [Actinomycetota bacterium]